MRRGLDARLLRSLGDPACRCRPVGRRASSTVAFEVTFQGPDAPLPGCGPTCALAGGTAPSRGRVGPGRRGPPIGGWFTTQVVMHYAAISERLNPDLQRTHEGAGHGPALPEQPPIHEDRQLQIRPPLRPHRRVGHDACQHLRLNDDEGLINEIHAGHTSMMPDAMGTPLRAYCHSGVALVRIARYYLSTPDQSFR